MGREDGEGAAWVVVSMGEGGLWYRRGEYGEGAAWVVVRMGEGVPGGEGKKGCGKG